MRAHAWDSFEHHISAWNSQLNSLDQKLELMSRTQDGRLTEQGNRMKLIPDIDFKLDGMGRKLGELGAQVQVGITNSQADIKAVNFFQVMYILNSR